jgi:hypothetical protein
MKIFKKVETNGHPIKDALVKRYKHEMKLSTYVMVTCMACVAMISHKSPVFLSVAILFQALGFTKYLYDRRVALIKAVENIKV